MINSNVKLPKENYFSIKIYSIYGHWKFIHYMHDPYFEEWETIARQWWQDGVEQIKLYDSLRNVSMQKGFPRCSRASYILVYSQKKKIFHPEDLPSRLPAYVCVYYIYMNARDSHNRISARDVTELDGFLIRVIRWNEDKINLDRIR